jgi:hypothetical protein
MYRAADVVGLPLAEVVSPQLQDEVLEGVRRVSREGGQWERKELEISIPGGSASFWNLTALCLRKAQPNPPHEVALVLVDVTEEVIARRTVEQAAEEKTRLLDELGERERLATALNQLNRLIGSNQEPDEILRQVVQAVPALMGVEGAGVSLRWCEEWELRYASGRSAAMIGLRLPEVRVPVFALAADTGETQVVNNTRTDPRFGDAHFSDLGVQSVLVTPLLVRGEAIGVLAFSHFLCPVPFSSAQVDFAGQLAASISQALHRARVSGSYLERPTTASAGGQGTIELDGAPGS